MTPEATKLVKAVDRAVARLAKYRADCSHANKTQKYGSNTGNYDPSADKYWIDFDCLDCGKHWTEYQ